VRPAFSGQSLNFRVITLKEPPKHDMLDYLDRQHRQQPIGPAPTRCARVEVIAKVPGGKPGLYDILVDLDNSSIMRKKKLEGKHSYIDSDYMKEVEQACLADQNVQEDIRKLQLPKGSTAIVEPWAYATDGMNDMTERVTMVREERGEHV
jgi:primary-amine oxidase